MNSKIRLEKNLKIQIATTSNGLNGRNSEEDDENSVEIIDLTLDENEDVVCSQSSSENFFNLKDNWRKKTISYSLKS